MEIYAALRADMCFCASESALCEAVWPDETAADEENADQLSVGVEPRCPSGR